MGDPDGMERFTLGEDWVFLRDVNCDLSQVGNWVESPQVVMLGSGAGRGGGHSQVRWNLIEADASVTLHVLSAVDLQVSVGVDRDQHGANVGLGVGGGGSEVSPRGPGAAPPSSLQPCICGPSAPSAFPLGPHVDQVLPEAPPQVLDEGGLAGEVLQQHEVLHPHPVTGSQRALHGDPHPVTAQGLQGWATGESQRRRGRGRPLLPFATAWTTEGGSQGT